MATTPKLLYPDGSGTTTTLTVTTNVNGLSFAGTIDQNTIDIQVDVNGSGFVSDPTMIEIIQQTFRIPNPSSFPDGLQLDRGKNVIRLRAVDLSGGVSPAAYLNITVVSDSDPQMRVAPPTGVLLRRRARSVEVYWSETGSGDVSGYNVYASTGAGGTNSGYLKVNMDMIPASSPTTTDFDEGTIHFVEYDLTDADGSSDIQIVTDAVDPATGGLVARKSVNWFSLLGYENYKLQINLVGRQLTKRYVFSHNRADSINNGILNSDVFGAVLDEEPLFYVVTAVYFDKKTGNYVESRYSQELSGTTLPLDRTTRGIPIRDQTLVARDYINEIQKAAPALSLIPGSTVREVHIEPFSNEAEKVYFLLDFVHRTKSFTALLQIDDPNLTGTSIDVSLSQYKQQLRSALGIVDDAVVQNLIDGAFDSLSENFGVPRQGLRSAIVTQTFYMTTAPTRDMLVAQNAVVSSSTNPSAPRFSTRGAVYMFSSNPKQYYNIEKGRYEVKIEMIAQTAGSVGNVPAETLDTVVGGASGFKTINDVAADYGRDAQSNLELAETASRALFSLDTGTEGGYLQAAAATTGLFEAKLVKSGDSFMMRDWDPVRLKHIGGKVDIYVKGSIERTITESFAFQFEVAKNSRFDVIDAAQLIFRARDSRLSASNPIQEMLNNPAQDYGIRNHSVYPTGYYDLTGVVIIDYNTIQLNAAVPQPTTMLDDFVEGDYRYRSNNKFTPSLQPVRRVTGVVGTSSGTLDPDGGYALYKLQDPVLEGESTIATDYVSINQLNGIPIGTPLQVNDEQHVLIGQFEEPLGSVGINIFTLVVYSQDRLTTYAGPDSVNPDYLIINGSQTKSVHIVRTVDSNIPSGSVVSVDYENDENFHVTYVINDVVQRLQDRINTMKHITADVIVKQALENPMNISTTIQLMPNADQATTDQSIRTGMTNLTDKRGLGQPLHQSDVVGMMEGITGVDYLIQPFAKFTLQTNAIRVRETIEVDYEFLSTLSQGFAAVYILTQSLPFNTVDGGGVSTQYHGVHMDDLVMEQADSLNDVGKQPGRAWIIGSQGAVIPGYSDDATLYPTYLTAAAVGAARLKLTANKVVVSLYAGTNPYDSPSNHSFTATYMVSNDTGDKDINVSPIEYLTPGDLVITYKAV